MNCFLCINRYSVCRNHFRGDDYSFKTYRPQHYRSFLINRHVVICTRCSIKTPLRASIVDGRHVGSVHYYFYLDIDHAAICPLHQLLCKKRNASNLLYEGMAIDFSLDSPPQKRVPCSWTFRHSKVDAITSL